MPVTFLGRAKLDLGSDKVAAVEDGARRLYRHRAEAVAEYPAMEEMRAHARAGRMSALRNLDRLLARFADQVEATGGKVWWAGDAAEANAIVTRDRSRCRRRAGGQVEVDGHRGDRAQPRPRGRRHRGGRDRPG